MSSMFAPYTLVTGGSFTGVHGDAHHHYHGFRGPDVSEILYRATATAAFHNSDERFDPPKCHPKTRLAVLTKIMEWIKWEGNLDTFILWVYGPAGAGKSAIAQTIAEMCDEEMLLLASFFFSRNDPSRSTVKPLVATIAYQIITNLPQSRDIILAAIERDPLIFTKSLAVQVKSLIMRPLQSLAESGSFNIATPRLIIIDGLDECFDPKVQRNIIEVLANSDQRQHRLPLIFLIASRPEQRLSLAFSTGILPTVTTRIGLDESYLPDEDIEVFLTDKFQEIKSTHPLRSYIPPCWPHSEVLDELVKKSSGQFIYASTVIGYITSIRHKPTDRLDIVLGIRPAQKDLPFSELDALYTHILAGVEDIERALEILSVIFFCNAEYLTPRHWHSSLIEEFLSLQPGDVELYLMDLHSLVIHGPDNLIHILHASLRDFFIDPARSKTLWINPRARHAAFARRCFQILQLKAHVKIFKIGDASLVYHLDNAEMTPELCHNMINFSFYCLLDAIKEFKKHDKVWHRGAMVHLFTPRFLKCLKRLPSPEAHRISQTFQVHFDRILCNAVEKHRSSPGFTLLLGSILQYRNLFKKPTLGFETFPPGLVTSLYFVRQRGEGHILDDMGFSAIADTTGEIPGIQDFLHYFTELLENPERSGTHAFDMQKYATAAKECLQLYLCNHRKFSKGATDSYSRDKVLLRNKPWAWKIRLGAHSRIQKASRRQISLENMYISQNYCPPEGSEFYRSLAYEWALDLLPIFLDKSAISVELADVLRSCSFTTMAQQFRRKMMLARKAIETYLFRVDSAVRNL